VRRFFGLLTRRERWGLSLRGWIVFCGATLSIGLLVFFGSYPFLAVTHPVKAKVLVTEGWIHEGGIRTTVEEFWQGSYEYVLTTGGPQVGSERGASDPNTGASVIADWLNYRGIPKERLHAVPSHVVGRDRTYNSALTLRNWLREQHLQLTSLNIVTESTHARRTRFLYRKVFGNEVAIGVIAAANADYDANHWWRYSEGVRDVIDEGVAYIYATVFFHPARS
jgi:uncharacterized SAM-binding protein YcdF (DUF218 family)